MIGLDKRGYKEVVYAYQGLEHDFKSVPNYLQRKGWVIKITQSKLH